MARPYRSIQMKRRGNPNWGRSTAGTYIGSIPAIPTAFELEAKRLRLETFEERIKSPTLKMWVQRNCNTRFVPENVLKAMGINVLAEDHGSLLIG